MNLYLVTVTGHILNPHVLYVVAQEPTKAQELALDLVKRITKTVNYEYEYYVEHIELVASINTHRAKYLLAVQQ